MISTATLETTLGLLTIEASPDGILAIWYDNQLARATSATQTGAEPSPIISLLLQELAEYFNQQRQQFTVPLAPKGTAFQLKVWQHLQSIPYGETVSYQSVADAIGQPSATRAVANAIGKNPISILVPCHRVIGKNGRLTGYAGGLQRKSVLLTLEQAPFIP